MLELLSNPTVWWAFFTLTVLEIVLGIDNIIFISILTGRLPQEEQHKARIIGLSLAMVMRILLLLSIAWIMRLTTELFVVMDVSVTGRGLILILGGAFLIAKATREVHNSLEGDAVDQPSGKTASFFTTLAQIAIIDIVFSLDSVITAVGLAEHVETMIAAIVTSVVVMMFAAASIARFVDERPTIKMLALSFLMLIGFTLVADGVGAHVPKGYIYFAMAFAFGVELLNIRQKNRQAPVKLRRAQLNDLMDDD